MEDKKIQNSTNFKAKAKSRKLKGRGTVCFEY